MKNIQYTIFPVAIALLSLLAITCTNQRDYSSFGIYLAQENTLLISDLDILAYVKAEHKIILNQQGMAKWNSSIILYDSTQNPPIPVLAGGLYQKDFCVKLDDDIMYQGKIWTNFSSLSYNGIVLLDAGIECDSMHNWITIENGYASQPSTDLRENEKIFEFFRSVGKLQ